MSPESAASKSACFWFLGFERNQWWLALSLCTAAELCVRDVGYVVFILWIGVVLLLGACAVYYAAEVRSLVVAQYSHPYGAYKVGVAHNTQSWNRV